MHQFIRELNDILNIADFGIVYKAYDINHLFECNPGIPAEILNEAVMLIKNRVQTEAKHAWKANGYKGLIAIATGGGKSKVAINTCVDLITFRPQARILLVVPTQKLRDTNWKDEFYKWNVGHIYDNNVDRVCYASLAKMKGHYYSLIILDEAHNLTPANSVFFDNNAYGSVIALSATPPSEVEKIQVLERLQLPTVYEITLDVAVQLRLVAPYEVIIVETQLDDKDCYVKTGRKGQYLYITEKEAYYRMSRRISDLNNGAKTLQQEGELYALIMKRMRLIYNLKSKQEVAKEILERFIPREDRTLIFCGGIDQAKELADKTDKQPHTFHSKTNDRWLNEFINFNINRLTCINALNEGHNIAKIDGAVAVQVNRKERNFIQRMGRTVRYRPNHISRVFVICAVETEDSGWVSSATKNLNPISIKRIRFEDLHTLINDEWTTTIPD